MAGGGPAGRGSAGRFAVGAAAAALLLLAVTGCGSPRYTYVKNSGERTYFKVPAGWNRIGQHDLDQLLSGDDPDSAAARARPQVSWSVAYDATRPADATHLFGLDGGEQPFVYAQIRRVSDETRDQISLNLLRDAFLPVTAQSRQQAADAGQPLTGFELLRDQVLTPGGGLRGVRSVFNYRLGRLALLQTFDVTTYASDDGRLYELVVRCSARCYRNRSAELDAVARSFTVRKHR
ncbi:hypothetical protein [Actinomadura gamaensis]|uniref:Lipoprotein n=1 Tax=Actinomadura gamaensis TaxID=1763541 RepID=A0ABV9TUI9_9ACTN